MYKIKDLVFWERITGKSFVAFDVSSPGDYVALMYATSGKCEEYTLEEYSQAVGSNPKVAKAQARRMARLDKIAGQMKATPAEAIGGNDGGKDGEASPGSLTETAYWLISEGFNAEYLLEKLPLWELPHVAKAYAAKRDGEFNLHKSTCETIRLAAWYSVLPHVKRGTVKKPTDMFLFPWELRDKKKNGQEALRKHQDEFKRFMEDKEFHERMAKHLNKKK